MRFEKVVISNYRQYQSLEFSFSHGPHDLHVIIAQNGVGKTNLLNALTWCLYGKEPHLGSTEHDPDEKVLPRANTTAIELARQEGKNEVLVQVEIHASDGKKTIIFTRSQTFKVTANGYFEGKEDYAVQYSEGLDYQTFTGEAAKTYVDRYMPETIREHVFFDGEHLNNYFLENTAKRIKDAVYSISQVDAVTRIAKRLGDVIAEYRKDAGKKAPALQEKLNAVMEAKAALDAAEKDRQALQEQITVSEERLQEIGGELRDRDNLPELEKEYDQIKAERESQEKQLQTLRLQIMGFIREKQVALAYYPAAKKALTIIDAKRATHALPPAIDRKILQAILDTHECAICGHDLDLTALQKVSSLLAEIEVSSETSNLLSSIYDELTRLVEEAEAYPAEKLSWLKRLEDLEQQITATESKMQALTVRIDKTAESEKGHVRTLFQERQGLEKLLVELQKKLGAAEYRCTQAAETHDKCIAAHNAAMKKNQECARLQALIDYASRCSTVMTEIEREIMGDIREQLEKRSTEEFLKLIWKKNTYDHIELTDTYSLRLLDRAGHSCVTTCSAAERCLLALAFTLALHEVSGFNSILFIDTPVARVSDQNRANFADVLAEVSCSKQIIMTFTPDEYSDEIRQVFAPLLASTRTLELFEESVVRIAKEG